MATCYNHYNYNCGHTNMLNLKQMQIVGKCEYLQNFKNALRMPEGAEKERTLFLFSVCRRIWVMRSSQMAQ